MPDHGAGHVIVFRLFYLFATVPFFRLGVRDGVTEHAAAAMAELQQRLGGSTLR